MTATARTANLSMLQVHSMDAIRPAPDNVEIYRGISFDDVTELVNSIRERGIQEPILLSSDGFIISGHRRYQAAQYAGLSEVPVRVHPISRADDHAGFVKLLVEMNTQRVKGADVLLAEAVVKSDPTEAHKLLVEARAAKEERRMEDCTLTALDSQNDGERCALSPAKALLLQAIQTVVEEQRAYWPLSVRQIHYRLLGENAPLIHASKPNSRYQNDLKSYRALVDVAARARVAFLLPWEAIEDETRPVDVNKAFHGLRQFIQSEVGNFLNGYWRNLLQSQPHHIEIVAEKLTVRNILAGVAQERTMPMTIGRGMCSLPAKKKIASRYRISGKAKLILLVVSDLDPAGDAIAEDLLKSFRRDFGIYATEAYKVALTIDQVEEYDLEPSMEAKETSPTYNAFVEKYGITDAYELEALEPSDLEEILTNAIDEVIDTDAYNQELAAEETDATKLVAIQERTAEFFKSLKLD